MANIHGIPDFDHEYKSLRLSALRKAVDIAPYVHETTIGPNSKGIEHFNDEIYHSNLIKSNKLESKYIKPLPEVVQKVKSNDTFTFEKLLHECEVQRRETANNMFKNMLSRMVAKRTEMMTKFWNQQELEYEKRSQERRNRELEILQEWALGDKMAKLEQEKLDEENRAHSERMRLLLEKQLESTKLFESLNASHRHICVVYQEITNIEAEDDTFSQILSKHEIALNSILTAMNSITESCKSASITRGAVQKALSLASKMNDLKNLVLKDYKDNILEKQLASKERSPPENTERTQEVKSDIKSETEVKEKTDIKVQIPKKVSFCSDKSLKGYLELKQYLEEYENSYSDLLRNDSLKKFRFDCQKAVNTPVNAISSVSGAHLKDKYDKLFKLLSGDQVKVGDSYVSCAFHPEGKAYCINLLAKKIVRQGEQLVSSNPEAAFPIASVTIALWANFPDLGKLITAYFQRDCPYLIPLLMPHCEGQTDEEYYKSRGYRYNEDSTVEKQDKFLKRMSGIFRLCAAIWVTKMPYSVNLPHPQGLAHAWRWMAAFVNLDPEPDITATLLYDFLSVCGSDFFKYYKSQFVKVLQYLLTDYQRRIDKIDEGGPKTRLEVFLQNVMKQRHISPPTGLLSDKIW